MADGLDLRGKVELRQRQILAPQVFQSLRVLGLPAVELRALVETELNENPVLEVEDFSERDDEESSAEEEPTADEEPPGEEEMAWEEFAEHLDAGEPPPAGVAARDSETVDAASLIAQPTTLQDHLIFQLHLSDLTAEEEKIGEAIIGSVDDDGYFTRNITEIAATYKVDEERVERALAVIQGFDPPGVAARDLTECLRIQLIYLGIEDERVSAIVTDHLDDLARKRYEVIARRLKVSVETVRDYAALVRSLSPKPGALFRTSSATQYIMPDVVVRELDGRLTVLGNDEAVPTLRISPLYRRLLAAGQADDQTQQYVKGKLKSAMELIKSLDRRKDTLVRIAKLIVSHQRDFFVEGPRALRPLTRAQVARELQMHPSTVSRALAGKYIATPFGTFEFKYFFAGGYQLVSGEDVSATSVKKHIRDLIEAEPAGKPHSDQKLAELLRSQGFEISRRTVAKYRDELRIEPSYRRKR